MANQVDAIRWAAGEALIAITPRSSALSRAGTADEVADVPWSVADRNGFKLTLNSVMGHVESGSDNAVFTASTVVRRLATGCNTTVRAVVEAALRTAGAEAPGTEQRVHASQQLLQSLLDCDYEPADLLPTAESVHTYERRRLSPARRFAEPMQRTGAWRCLNTLRGLPRKIAERAQRTMRREMERRGGAVCGGVEGTDDAARMRTHGLIIHRGLLNSGALAEVREAFRRVGSEGDVHGGRTTFEGSFTNSAMLYERMPKAAKALDNALSDWCKRGVLPPSHCPQLTAASFVTINKTLAEQTCKDDYECGCDWHMDGDFTPDGSRATKLWLMVDKVTAPPYFPWPRSVW